MGARQMDLIENSRSYDGGSGKRMGVANVAVDGAVLACAGHDSLRVTGSLHGRMDGRMCKWQSKR